MKNPYLDDMISLLAPKQKTRLRNARATETFTRYVNGESQAVADDEFEARNIAIDLFRIPASKRNRERKIDPEQRAQITADVEFVLRRFHEECWPEHLSNESFRDCPEKRACSEATSKQSVAFIAEVNPDDLRDEGASQADIDQAEVQVDVQQLSAQSMCMTCPLRVECLASSMNLGQFYTEDEDENRQTKYEFYTEECGIYGGYRSHERDYLVELLNERLDEDYNAETKFPNGSIGMNIPLNDEWLSDYRRNVVSSFPYLEQKNWNKAKRTNRKMFAVA